MANDRPDPPEEPRETDRPDDESDTSSVEIVDTYEIPVEALTSDDDDDEIVVTAQKPVERLTGAKRPYEDNGKEEDLLHTQKKLRTEFTDPNVIPSELRLSRIDDLGSEVNSDTVSLEYILNQAGLKYMWQFNFSVDIEFVMNSIEPWTRKNMWSWFIVSGKPQDIIYYNSVVQSLPDQHRVAPVLGAPLHPSKNWSIHHAKLMVLGFTDDPEEDTKDLGTVTRFQIIISTSNLTPLDWHKLTQGVWMSPHLRRGETTKRTDFRADFLGYLGLYKLPALQDLIEELGEFSFDEVTVDLVMSAPGNFNVGKEPPQMGVDGLGSKMAQMATEKEEDTDKFTIEVSSLGSFGKDQKYFKEMFLKALNGDKDAPDLMKRTQLLWPSVESVRTSIAGYASGVALHENSRGGVDSLRKAGQLYEWKSLKAGRQFAMPHIKTYTRTNADKTQIRWIVLTSANLSQAAWGVIRGAARKSPKGMGPRVDGSSWELGVVISPRWHESASGGGVSVVMVPVYGRDRLTDSEAGKTRELLGVSHECKLLCVRMAYDLNAMEPYKQGSQPWDGKTGHSHRDWLGRQWPLE